MLFRDFCVLMIFVVVLSILQGRFVSGSPQSTLCAFGSGCGCRKGSSHGSPNGACKLSSERATWDLLHAAAGEVERMRLSQQEGCYGFGYQSHNGGPFVVPQRKPSPITLPSKNNNTTTTNPDLGFYTQQSLSHQQLQLAQVSSLYHTSFLYLYFRL